VNNCENISDFLSFWLSNLDLVSNQGTLRSYYRNYVANFGKRIQEYYRWQTKEVLDVIKEKGKPTLLDAGCGCGTESLWFSMQGAEVKGIDVIKEHVALADERKLILEKITGNKLPCHFEFKSILDLSNDSKFDIIWMEQAFHHIEPRNELLDLLSTLLNQNGVLIISESNAWNPLIQASLFKMRGFNTIIKNVSDGKTFCWGNERIIVPLFLSRQLKQHGFAVQKPRYYRIFPSNKSFDKFLRPEFFWLEKNFPRFLIPCFTHYNIIAHKI
jgi:2-polyprenyl-3-methyl-5-hydroxy-6-metoxy-1,4-benzoquinol methylase